ncbi:MAG: ferritin-like domain-containing protein [Microthrixaceae bacterium]
MSSEELHEPREQLPDAVLNQHRAIVSLMEELEAVDWYNQRAAVCSDPELRAILEHNRDEEKEHAAMLLEWLRRNDDGFENELTTYLFHDHSILDAEAESMGRDADSGGKDAPPKSDAASTLDLGDLKGQENT